MTYALLALAPVSVLAQQSDEDWLEDCRDGSDRLVAFCEVRVSDAPVGTGSLRVEPGANGGVAFVGWDENRVEVHARVSARARTESEAAELASEVDVSLGDVIGADGPRNDRNRNWSVSFLVYVPAAYDAEAETMNGPLSVTGVTGRLRLNARNGPIRLRDVGGDVVVRTQNGPLSVELSGSQWDGAGLDAETVNGPVTLTVPDGFNAALETGTVNGPFQSDIPITMTIQGRVGRPFNGTLGQGGPPIRVVTVNGPVRIRGT
jgi:hypothetical protein